MRETVVVTGTITRIDVTPKRAYVNIQHPAIGRIETVTTRPETLAEWSPYRTGDSVTVYGKLRERPPEYRRVGHDGKQLHVLQVLNPRRSQSLNTMRFERTHGFPNG